VDKLPGGKSGTRTQIGEVTLDGAGSDARELGGFGDRSAGGDGCRERTHLAVRRLR
jgi:hypothetical protein